MNTKNIIILIGIVVAAVVLFWFAQQMELFPFGQQTQEPETNQGDTTPAIEQALDQVDIKDLDAELQGIDTDVNSL